MKKAKAETTDSIRADLAEVEQSLAAARQNVSALAAERASVLLTGDDAAADDVDERAFAVQRQVERLELQSADLAARLKAAEAAEKLAKLRATYEAGKRLAEGLPAIEKRRAALNLEDAELAHEQEALRTFITSEANAAAREIGSPRIQLPPVPADMIQRFSRPADDRAVHDRLKQLREAAAAA